MPIIYSIDRDRGIACVKADGKVTHREDMECFGNLLSDAEFRPGLLLLLDYRGRESVASSQEVRELVEHSGKVRPILGDARCAIVVSSDVAFGMGRMYSALSEHSFVPTNVFRDIDEARQWLGRGSPG